MQRHPVMRPGIMLFARSVEFADLLEVLAKLLIKGVIDQQTPAVPGPSLRIISQKFPSAFVEIVGRPLIFG
jgi:hypothetical protein